MKTEQSFFSKFHFFILAVIAIGIGVSIYLTYLVKKERVLDESTTFVVNSIQIERNNRYICEYELVESRYKYVVITYHDSIGKYLIGDNLKLKFYKK